MKNVLLLLITLTTFINVYASFPVTETQQTEILELITSNSTESLRNNWLNIYAFGSLILFILALFFILMIVIGIPTFSISGPAIAEYISYAIFSTIAAIVLGIISFIKK